MANEVTIVIKAHNQTGGAFSQAEHSAGKLTGMLRNAGAAAAGFLASQVIIGGLAKLKDGFDRSVAAASNLGESVNAVQRIFKTSSKQILDWGIANANAFGLSRRAFNELVTPLGAMLKNSGISLQNTSRFTIELTKRAADMASVFNKDVSEALMAIQAGLRGESDPLEQFGVKLSAAAVQAQALHDTGKKSASSLTEMELATARVNLIMAQTADVAGDFAATSDGLANSQRILAARNEDLEAQIGEKFLPLMARWNQAKLDLVSTISDRVIPAVENFADTALPKLREAVSGAWHEVADFLKPTYEDVTNFMKNELGPELESLKDDAVEPLSEAVDTLKVAWADNKDEMAQFTQELTRISPLVKPLVGLLGGSLVGGLVSLAAQLDFVMVKIGAVVRAWNGLRELLGLGDPSKLVRRGSAGGGGGAGGRNIAREHGGIVGAAAAGGLRAGLTLVGESGPELADLAPGTMVHSAPDSARMLAGAGGQTRVAVELSIDARGDTRLGRLLQELLDAGILVIRPRHIAAA